MKSLRIAWQLLWANRWLWLLLVLWPWGMAAILLVGGLHPAPEDVEAALEQQSIYGLALVAFAGGALLGNEQRSRRIVLVLSRAVSRRQYLGALWLAAFLPLVLYVLDLALTGPLLGAPAFVLWQTLGALLLLSLTTASLAVMASLTLPGVIAGCGEPGGAQCAAAVAAGLADRADAATADPAERAGDGACAAGLWRRMPGDAAVERSDLRSSGADLRAARPALEERVSESS